MAPSINTELELESPIEDIKHELVLNFVRTSSVIAAQGTALFRQFDLTEAQFNVLFALKYKRNEWTQSDLSKRLVVTRASITSVLDKLEAKELVTRNEVPENRRIYHVALTRKGRHLIDKVEPVYRAAIHRALDSFSKRECRDMITQMETIRSRAAQAE
ncbi:MAG TPA: MarR family transcriptional regulator [Candidatus Hydrogenedentes bacterium]|jgi:MarR family 2-MHQ and catechol resistance regulon transcriptional repressor|nr:MarR family transcriptional regulator [Candidatus Hydrogenedentota bacterium]HQM99544.1 MarR family transcriptional regulator [Candidatus Hydrogenedentota bacterium]